MDYKTWNQAIAEHFFTEEKGGTPVYLQVDPDELAVIRGLESADQARDNFCEAVRSAVGRDGTLEKFEDWVSIGVWDIVSDFKYREPPPFLAVLAAAVLAGYDMAYDPVSGLSSGAYYKRLCPILGVPEITATGRRRLTRWWKRLNQWLDVDKRGGLGQSTSYEFQGYTNIGFPLSQCTLRA